MAIDKEALKTLSVGERIKVLRGEQSQEELASIVGVTPSAIGMYEQNRRMPRGQTQKAIADYFGLLVDDLFF